MERVLSKNDKNAPSKNMIYQWRARTLSTRDHPETKSLFNDEDWDEMIKNSNQEVHLEETTMSRGKYKLFDELK